MKGKGGQAKDGAHGGAHDFGVVEFDRSPGEKDAFASGGFGCAHDYAQVAGVRDAVEDEEWATSIEDGFAIPGRHRYHAEDALRCVRV